jgi:hypothetical protein
MNTETQELTVLDNFRELAVYDYDVISEAAEAIEETVMAEVCDVSTPKGRDREKSLAFKVSQAKQRVVKMANASIEDARATVKAVTNERQRLEGLFDGIRDKRKADSVEWEAKEQERIEGHKSAIADIKRIGDPMALAVCDSRGIKSLINGVRCFVSDQLQEFASEGEIVKSDVLDLLDSALEAATKREAQAAELKRLQEAEEKRIADAEKAEAEKRQLEAEAARKEQERLDAIKAKEEAEKAEDKRLADIEQAKADAIKATEDRMKQQQADMDAEAKRLADIEDAKRISAENAELKRQADKDHRAKVKEEAFEATCESFRMTNATMGDVRSFIDAMEAGDIPHVQINF